MKNVSFTINPGMTVGGTGDALAGICLSLLSQGLNSFDAAMLAPYLNGKAGDLAYEAQGYFFFRPMPIEDFEKALKAQLEEAK